MELFQPSHPALKTRMKVLILVLIILTSNSIFGQMGSLKKGDKWQYDYPNVKTVVDENRNIAVVPSPNFTEFEYFEGLAKVQFDMYVGFVDSSKTIVIPVEYISSSGVWPNRFVASRAIIENNGKWGVIDTADNLIIPFEYDIPLRFVDSLFFITQSFYTDYSLSIWACFDRNGKELLALRPHVRKCHSCEITFDEILLLQKEYQIQDSLEKSTNFSKEKAIQKAKRKGYYWEGDYPYKASITLDSGQWIISGIREASLEKDFNCKFPGGCFGLEDVLIIIDANTGAIIKKSKFKYASGRWEGQPQPVINMK
jgi:hypothetical protein